MRMEGETADWGISWGLKCLKRVQAELVEFGFEGSGWKQALFVVLKLRKMRYGRGLLLFGISDGTCAIYSSSLKQVEFCFFFTSYALSSRYCSMLDNILCFYEYF